MLRASQVCDAFAGWCRCPGGWRGDACDVRMNRPCSQFYRSHGFEPHDEPLDWHNYGAHSRCSGYCDKDIGACYCPSNTTHGMVPASLDAPAGALLLLTPDVLCIIGCLMLRFFFFFPEHGAPWARRHAAGAARPADGDPLPAQPRPRRQRVGGRRCRPQRLDGARGVVQRRAAKAPLPLPDRRRARPHLRRGQGASVLEPVQRCAANAFKTVHACTPETSPPARLPPTPSWRLRRLQGTGSVAWAGAPASRVGLARTAPIATPPQSGAPGSRPRGRGCAAWCTPRRRETPSRAPPGRARSSTCTTCPRSTTN